MSPMQAMNKALVLEAFDTPAPPSDMVRAARSVQMETSILAGSE